MPDNRHIEDLLFTQWKKADKKENTSEEIFDRLVWIELCGGTKTGAIGKTDISGKNP